MQKILIALATGLVLSAPLQASDAVLFSYEGKDYTVKDLPAQLVQEHFTIEKDTYNRTLALVNQAVLDLYIKQQAAKQNKSTRDIQDELFKPEPVSDEEILAMYNQYKMQIGQPLEQVREALKQRLSNLKTQEKLLALVAKIKADDSFTLKLKAPVAPTLPMDVSAFPTKGAKNALVKIVEVADYRCPHCKSASAMVKGIMEKYKGQVSLTYVDLPVVQARSGITQHVMAGAYCARQQGKYWEYHEAAYAMQKDLSMESPGLLARQLKLDKNAFAACMKDDKSKNYVDMSTDFARSLGVVSTPTFFFNGQRVNTQDFEAELEQAIATARKK